MVLPLELQANFARSDAFDWKYSRILRKPAKFGVNLPSSANVSLMKS